jgi:ATP-dependent DNA helicase RecG
MNAVLIPVRSMTGAKNRLSAELDGAARTRLTLAMMADTTDGFAIAERDLELRGPGDFFGTRQSGLPRLRTGDLLRDRDIMEDAHREARRLVESGGPGSDLLTFVQEKWQEQFGLIEVG